MLTDGPVSLGPRGFPGGGTSSAKTRPVCLDRLEWLVLLANKGRVKRVCSAKRGSRGTEGWRDELSEFQTKVFMTTSKPKLSYFFLTLTDMRMKSINVQLLRMNL